MTSGIDAAYSFISIVEPARNRPVACSGPAIITRRSDGKFIGKVADAQGEMNVRVSDGEFIVYRKP